MSQQYGLRKAIEAGKAATRKADERCQKGAELFDACKTVQDIRNALDWMKTQDFFFATDSLRAKLKSAFDAARERVSA